MSRITGLSQYSGVLNRADIWLVVDGDSFPRGMKMSGQQVYALCKGADAAPNFGFTIKSLASGETPTATITGTYPNINVELSLPSGKDATNPKFNFSAKSLTNGQAPTAEMSGTYPDVNVLLGLPAGKDAVSPAFTFTTKSLANNQTPTATITGTYPNINVELGLPSGKDAANPNLQFIISMLANGATPTANVTGTYPNLFVTLGIPAPKDAANPNWTLTTEKGTPGSNPQIQVLGTYPNQTIKFIIPEGLRGLQGKPLVVLPSGNYGNWDEDQQRYVDSGVQAAATVDLANIPVSFTASTVFENIVSGDTVPVAFGKIAKWFTDKINLLKALAFKDKVNYNTDIDNIPVIPSKTSQLTNDGNFQTDQQVSAAITTHNTSSLAHQTQFSNYQQKEAGKGLSTNDFTSVSKAEVDFLTGINNVTSLASLPASRQTVYAEISANQSVSVTSGLNAGRTLQVFVKNTGATDVTVTIPNSGNFVSMSGTSATIKSGKYVEIHITCISDNLYNIRVGSQQ